jgi:exodeoxyribonuclease V alpha subunit
MSTYPSHLSSYVGDGFVNERDLRAVAVFVDLALRGVDIEGEKNIAPTFTDTVWLALARALAAYRDQHVCVHLDEYPGWESELRSCTSLVAEPHNVDATKRQPFILDLGRLYVHRAWQEECVVAEKIRSRSVDALKVITGGPGTGKTTTVAKQLVERLSSQGDTPVLVALAAPTGKAAKRMTEAMAKALREADAPQDVRDMVLASPATTIHSLLGSRPNSLDRTFKFHAGNRLSHNLVIVDEMSMLSLSMMHNLVSALNDDAELILVGDPDQLASVEAGTVLADIVAGFPPGRYQQLTVPHRFKDQPHIVEASTAIRDGDASRFMTALSGDKADVEWIDPELNPKRAQSVLDEVVTHAASVMTRARSGDLVGALAENSKLQVLCAHRNGKMGVSGWNRVVEQRLNVVNANQWYVGRPIIITKNDKTTGLFNGDVGIIGDVGGQRVAQFGTADAGFTVPVTRLPPCDTVHALTIHKSQGSEYDHVVVVLPDLQSRILTRELLYTGVTRAAKKLTLIGSEAVITQAVERPIRRATGLSERL